MVHKIKRLRISSGGNHTTNYSFYVTGFSLNNQRIMLKITKSSGVDLTMCYNTNDFATRLLAPIANCTPVPPTPTPDPTFWDRSNIPTPQNVMIYKFLNRTYGKYSDSQVYWSFNGVTHYHRRTKLYRYAGKFIRESIFQCWCTAGSQQSKCLLGFY